MSLRAEDLEESTSLKGYFFILSDALLEVRHLFLCFLGIQIIYILSRLRDVCLPIGDHIFFRGSLVERLARYRY